MGDPFWAVDYQGEHGNTPVASTKVRPGIHAELKHEVDTYIDAGTKPMVIVNKLRAKFKETPRSELIPNKRSLWKQVANRTKVVLKQQQGPFKLESKADLLEWLKSHSMSNDPAVLARQLATDPHKLVVLPGTLFFLIA